jgi:putative hydrolase of the HAD superfamily
MPLPLERIMKKPCPSALVLGFGGVVSRTLFETHAQTERALKLAPGTLTWRGPFDVQSDPMWQDIHADRISERGYWMARSREVGHLVGEVWDHKETLVQRARGADVEAVIRPEARVAIEAARRSGKRLAILSNELDLCYGADVRARLPLLQGFDLVLDASCTGVPKPDPRAYAAIADRLGLSASECVFVDDHKRHVDGARRAGMQAVHFNVLDPAASYRFALHLLGLAAPPPLLV